MPATPSTQRFGPPSRARPFGIGRRSSARRLMHEVNASMSISYSITETESFTITHARRIASKVATDLKRFQRFYGSPSDERIDQYEIELTLLLKHDAVDNV